MEELLLKRLRVLGLSLVNFILVQNKVTKVWAIAMQYVASDKNVLVFCKTVQKRLISFVKFGPKRSSYLSAKLLQKDGSFFVKAAPKRSSTSGLGLG